MGIKLINIGFGNIVSANRIIAIVSPDSAPIKRIIQEARDRGVLIDATYGRRTRAVIITDSDHLILSAVQPETVAHRLASKETKRQLSRKGLTNGNSDKKEGLLIVLSGPSGAGKGTVCAALRHQMPELTYSVSVTTRTPRTGEQEGVNYFFRTRSEFKKMIAEDGLLEWAEYVGTFMEPPVGL